MASEESDDEPLSNLAAAKRTNPEKFKEEKSSKYSVNTKKKKRKKLPPKRLSSKIKLNRELKHVISQPVIERPSDVWLYLKDFNATGPYSCLLCPEWFINKSKVIAHYILNHKKDFCGICRYFVPDREVWWTHLKFHTPWPCSQCVDNFQTEAALRAHLSSVHKLVHCKMCHFRVPDGDQYHMHLVKKHNFSNVAIKDEEILWELEYDGSTNFLCLLCSKSNNPVSTFFNHYMGYHHFTLKCFTKIISGKDLPFTVSGADVSTEFVDGQLKNQMQCGYLEMEKQKQPDNNESDHNMADDTNAVINFQETEIKLEPVSDSEYTPQPVTKPKRIRKVVKNDNEYVNAYKGDEDFDITLTELIIIYQCYYDYVNQILIDINFKTMPENSSINYQNAKDDVTMNMSCAFCKNKHETRRSFITHVNKMHSVKMVPIFSCRVCVTTFDSQHDLDKHIIEELGEFDDLWICQFCDKEFDNRESTRRHLTEHWQLIEYDNCFSPHLGFKCRYCPTLFWNETDRETHQVRVHFIAQQDDFYKCGKCSDIFSDKIWFIHHFIEKHQVKKDKMPLYLLKCSVCAEVMANIDDTRTHFDIHHPDARKVYCSMDSCQYRPLSQRKSFKFHLRTVHNPATNAIRPVSCTVCGRDFVSARALSSHMAQVHGPGKFKCKICREVMHTLDERKLHYLLRHPGRHPFECVDCGKSFQYKSSLYMHRQEHSPNKQSFTCTYCGKVFMKKDSFREHVQIHEGPRHACSYCPMRFVQRSNMLRHERRHTGERPYACPHCPRTFADKGACTSHTRTHTKDQSYACIYCGQTFVQKSKLTYHIRKHTGENLETCSVCSKLFTSACSLREHMKTHDVKRATVKCPMCDRKYQDERHMMGHLRTSHTSGQFTCPLCPKTLTSAAGLRHHVITHSHMKTLQCKCCPKSCAVRSTMMKHLRRRHGLSGTEINIKDYYKCLDPRDCNLGLDEEVMNSIFGPKKKTVTDILMGDFVTLTQKLEFNKGDKKDEGANEESSEEEENNDEDDNSNESEKSNEEYCSDKAEKEKKFDEKSDEECVEDELEPTDFVSVKIEHIDEDEMQ